MKKKILALCLVVVLAVTAVTGATLAYFTDKDKDINVMVAGNVKIVQNETEHDGTEYVDGQTLLPAVYLDENNKPYNPETTSEGPKGGTTSYTGPDGEPMAMYTDSLNNEIDKVISVTNRGTLDAYVRTFVLIENNNRKLFENNSIHYAYNNAANIKFNSYYSDINLDLDGDGTATPYVLLRFEYQDPLAAGTTSAPSLKQFWLDPSVDNTWYDNLDANGLTIVAFSQAVQTTGFKNATEAFEAAFGPFTEENVAKWMGEANVVKTTGANNTVEGGNSLANP